MVLLKLKVEFTIVYKSIWIGSNVIIIMCSYRLSPITFLTCIMYL